MVLCIILGILDYASDQSKEKLKSFILLMVVITLMALTAIFDNKLSYLIIGIMIVINVVYIIRMGKKANN